ncbi:glycoside hydrolase superfamily, partial [Truncatella angustata]
APSNITPGADNFGEHAAGGLAGVATSVADRNPRQSGLDAMNGTNGYGHGHGQAYEQGQGQHGYDHQAYPDQSYYGHGQGYDRGYDQSYGQLEHDYTAFPPGQATPSRSQHSFASDPFDDGRYSYGQRLDPRLGQVNPNDIMDDGDEGLEYTGRSARTSRLNLGNNSSRSSQVGGTGAAAGTAGAAGAGAAGVAAGLLGAKGSSGYQGAGANEYDLGAHGAKEQSEWIKKQEGGKKRWKWLIIVAVGLIVAGGIAGGVVGALMNKKSSSNGQSASQDSDANGDLSINSTEIQALLNNANLHKVFPGVDYTPINTQYPDCISNPASQNNITRDVAVLSQLTNVIRLYGTDCNQTEMTIHALKQLEMEDDMRIWLGVWQDANTTTNDRQLSQMWDILDNYGDKYFEGLIVANEILFRKQMNITDLGDLLDSVRNNVSDMNLNLKVATSDLGDNWTAELASKSDAIMSNIHPFFGGINEKQAASWTWSFWQNHNTGFMKTDAVDNIISEIGWPSQGGTDCGSDTVTDCPDAAVASVDGMNQLMEDWVCDALTNGTNYFWFEMFDEPWKIMFNTDSENWEDHWGLMDVNRNLKNGIKIPDCGGKTV